MKDTKSELLNIVLIALFAIFLVIAAISILREDENQVCFEKNCFEVELAVTEEQQETGLTNRFSLDKDKGMLFIFNQEGNYPFWMKGMQLSLDIIWIDKNGVVVDIVENVKPCAPICFGIYPEKDASYVLELNANTSERIGLDLEDKVEIKIKI